MAQTPCVSRQCREARRTNRLGIKGVNDELSSRAGKVWLKDRGLLLVGSNALCHRAGQQPSILSLRIVALCEDCRKTNEVEDPEHSSQPRMIQVRHVSD